MARAKEEIVKKGLLSTTGLLVLLAILILVNVLFSYANVRWDATEENVYSLSQGTKNIVADLDQDVTLKVFYSQSNQNLPVPIKTYAKRAIEFLREYEYNSNGMVRVELYDPKPDSDEEEWAQKYGIEGMTTGTGDALYFGLVALAADQEEIIGFLDPTRERLLEYEVTRMIVRLQSPEKKTLGIVSFLPVAGMGQAAVPGMPPQQMTQPPWLFVTELKKTYDIKEIQPSATEIEKDVDLLLIVHPKMLSPDLGSAVDRFIRAGKDAIIMLDPVCIMDNMAGNNSRGNKASMFDEFLKAWGVKMDIGKAVADLDQATRVRNQFNVIEDNPTWISARGDALNKDSVITANLETLLMPVAGSFSRDEKFNMEWEVLVESTPQSGLVDSFVSGLGARTIHKDFVSGQEKLALAVRIHGLFPSAFPAPVKDETDNGTAPASVILIGDVDMIADNYYVQKQNFMGFAMNRMFNDNLNFVLNATELLTGDKDLIGIRSRGKFERPFTTVKELENQAKSRWLAKEKELVEKSEATTKKLRELESKKDVDQKMILSPAQQKEIEQFKEQRIIINKELKEVRKNLRADIESLGRWVKFVNTFAMAFVVSLCGVAFGLYRRKKMRRS